LHIFVARTRFALKVYFAKRPDHNTNSPLSQTCPNFAIVVTFRQACRTKPAGAELAANWRHDLPKGHNSTGIVAELTAFPAVNRHCFQNVDKNAIFKGDPVCRMLSGRVELSPFRSSNGGLRSGDCAQ
jgi:hypothetical protein